jgi:aminoglycoside phosphotransferase (APT) family kinase protein
MKAVDPEALRRYLRREQVPVAGALILTLVGGGRSNLTVAVSDGVHEWILRRPPQGDFHAGAHDVAREHRVMEALKNSVVPVPRMVAMCEDPDIIGAPFYVMENVDGVVLRSRPQVAELSPATRAELSVSLVDTLADLHEVDIASVGLTGLGKPQGYLERQLSRWHRQYASVSERHESAVDAIARTLAATLPSSPAAAIVHGDFRIDNVIVPPAAQGRIAAVLDWEMATLGDPLADLATLVMYWDEVGKPFNPITGGLTAFDGFLTVPEVVQRYATRRGLPEETIASLGWYLTFSKFKLAVILEQIHVRHSSGQTLGVGFDGIDLMVDQLLDECAVPTANTCSKGWT